ncbi:MAG: DNA internalization-related competence protein ComEC/Rec2 [Desulfovibrio sp.]|nr:DNA internalization-related competence protein ComEC/Rec2 [Desulfovibrio sp.]
MRQPPLQYALVWHSYLLAACLGLLASHWPLPASLALLLLAFLDRRLWRWQRLTLCAALFALAFACSAHAFERAAAAIQQQQAWGAKYRFCGIVKNVQGLTGNRIRVLLENVAPPGKKQLPGLCAWTWDTPLQEPIPGQTACISRPVKPVSAFANSGSDSYLASLFSQDIFWRAWSRGSDGNPELKGDGNFLARVRNRLKASFLDALPKNDNGSLSQADAILTALLFGDRRYLEQQTTAEFASATLAHSLALSGQHLAIAGLIGTLLVISWALCNSGLYLARPRRIWIAIAAIPLALFYLWIGNLPPSLLRAAAMLGIGALWLACGRSFSGLDLLCAALLLILIFNPLAIFNAGLQMSVLCVAVILIAWPGIARLLPEKSATISFRNRLTSKLGAIFAVSLVIQLAMLPLSLARFQIAGFWFPLNLLWLPVLGAIVLPCAFLGLLLCSLPFQGLAFLARISAAIAALPCRLLLDSLAFLKKNGWLAEPAFMLPSWPGMLAFALLACATAWLWGNRHSSGIAGKTRILLCLCLCLLAISPLQRLCASLSRTATIEALDVGQGQAILVSLPGAVRILIDGGGSYLGSFDPGKLVVAPQISLNSAPGLSAVINTHPDLDHLGGLFHILNTMRLEALFHNGREAQKPEPWNSIRKQPNAHALARGDVIEIGKNGWKLEVLSPARDMTHLDGNAASLVLRLVRGNTGFALFPGDAQKENLRSIIAENAGCEARLVFAPHHGSDKNFLPAFYVSARPEAVIACCGFMNRWRYPGKKLRTWLDAHGIPLFDTGTCGKITAAFEPDGLLVSTVK